MNKFKRGLIYLKTNIGKSILLFLVVLIAMAVISTCTIITQVSKKVVTDAYKGQQPYIYMYANYDNIDDSELDYTLADPYAALEPSIEDYENISKLEHVTEMYMSPYLYIENVITGPTYADGSENNYFNFLPASDIEQYYTDGYTYDFKTEDLSVENGIIVNDEVMELNGYTVGSTITLDFSSEYISGEIPEGYDNHEFKIIGTYNFTATQKMIDQEKQYGEEYGYDPDLTFTSYKTTIFTSTALTDQLIDDYKNLENASSVISCEVKFKIDDSENLEAVTADILEVTGKDLIVNLETPADAEQYGALSDIATMTTQVSILAGVVITVLVTLIIILFIRGRRTEFGILMALGAKKLDIYQQLVFEVGVLFAMAAVISIPVGYVLGNFVNTTVTSLYYGTTDTISSIPFSLMAIVIIVFITILLTLITTLIPTIYTLRMNPRKILL